MVNQDDPRLNVCGYAKLIGEGLEYYIRKYEVILGRASKSGQTDVVLGDNMNISRQHAKITFNFTNKSFELIVLGKNGVTVGSTLYTPASAPYPLQSQELLMVGDKIFHFLLPKSVDKIRKRDLEMLETLTAEVAQKKARPNPPPAAPAPPPPTAAVAMTSSQQPVVYPMQAPPPPQLHTQPVHMMHMNVVAGHPGVLQSPQAGRPAYVVTTLPNQQAPQ